jgi:replicative DNA helicase
MGKEERVGDVITVGIGIGNADGPCLQTRLRGLGVIQNKHIPPLYLTASVEQRRELLAGLLDTDGTCGRKGRVEFAVKARQLALDTLELIRSLGFKASFTEGRAKLNGEDAGPRYRINFTPGAPVFWLPRKRNRQRIQAPYGRAGYRCVKEITPVHSVPVRCIQVDSKDHSYLAGRSYTVTHNTESVSIGRVLWEIAQNPKIRVAVMSRTEKLALRIVRRWWLG